LAHQNFLRSREGRVSPACDAGLQVANKNQAGHLRQPFHEAVVLSTAVLQQVVTMGKKNRTEVARQSRRGGRGKQFFCFNSLKEHK